MVNVPNSQLIKASLKLEMRGNDIFLHNLQFHNNAGTTGTQLRVREYTVQCTVQCIVRFTEEISSAKYCQHNIVMDYRQ